MKTIARFLFTLYLVFFDLATIYTQDGEPNPDICTLETESYGPLPPPVPESFIMKSEVVDIENTGIKWEELYFDSVNLRAKYKTVSEGKETHYIFDYDVEEIITYDVYHPGVVAENDPGSLKSCIAKNMEDEPLHTLFGYRYQNMNGKRSRMFNSFEVLKFGGNYRYAYNGSMTIPDRGIPSDRYHGCFFSSFPKSTIDKTFFWSGREKVIPSSGPDPVPVKIDTYGEVYLPTVGDKTLKADIWQIENIPWFEGRPVFDDRIFQIPRGMYCSNYKNYKDVPNLAMYFSGRLETITFKRNMDGKLQDLISEDLTEIWYDYDSNLARVDSVADIEDDVELFFYMGPVAVSGVYDVGNGVVYYTNKLSGECLPFSIKDNFFLLSKNSNRKLAEPNEILGFDTNNLEYKGKNFARNIPCDVWAGQKKNSDGSEDFIEIYFATDGWYTDSDEDEEYHFPVRVTMVQFSVDSNKTYETVSETNIFKYKTTKPSSSVFDISGCLNTQNQKYFFLAIEQNAKDFLENRQKFLTAVRVAIKDYSKIGTLLRVQDVDIYVPSGRRNVLVSFSLMDSPQLFGKTTKTSGISLMAAEANLRRAIDAGDFQIAIVLDSKKEAQYIHALPGSLVAAIPQAEPLTKESITHEELDIETLSSFIEESKDTSQVPNLMFSDGKDKAPGGYSGGSLGGLAVGMLVLGIALGILLMYFYLKKYGQQEIPHGIMMEDKR